MMNSIQDIVVSNKIADAPFFCNLKKCKGACCTLKSDMGAPLRGDEIGKIDNILNVVKGYLDEENIEEIETNGFYEKIDEELFIRSVDNKECVFVFYENGIAKCSIEKANNDGKTNFIKPISCHLFPIRISDFGGDVLRYEKFEECNPAIEKGAAENVTVAEFCKEPLERHYGKQWYNEFIIAIGR